MRTPTPDPPEAVKAGLEAEVVVTLGRLSLQVQLSVGAGETVAVLGPNGAGKTTLLRALAGLQELDPAPPPALAAMAAAAPAGLAGSARSPAAIGTAWAAGSASRIVLDGEVLDDVATGESRPAEARPIGMVFQDHLLFPHLSALDNVAFGLRCRGVSKAAARQQARSWLARVDLAEHADLRPAALSGGQTQRVALARALATEPRLLLLDEPMAALDATTRAVTRRGLHRQLAGHDGVRIVVTHDPVEAAFLAERLLVVEAGRVVQQGSLADLAAAPRTPYVADVVALATR